MKSMRNNLAPLIIALIGISLTFQTITEHEDVVQFLNEHELHADKITDPLKIDYLSLDGSKVDDLLVEKAKVFSNIETLDLQGTAISDRALKNVCAHFPKLEYLNLQSTRISSAGIQYLKSCAHRIQKLRIANTSVDDSVLPVLLSMVKLQKLDITRTRISSAGCQQLLNRFGGGDQYGSGGIVECKEPRA
jgi:hypothetical protein